MKKQLRDTGIRCIKLISVLLLMMVGILSGLRSQNIDFSVACPNAPFIFPDQTAGGSISIPAITAVNVPGGQTVTMSIFTLDYNAGGFPVPICGPCTSPQLLGGITITAGANVTFSATTIDNSFAGNNITFTIRATLSPAGTFCDKNYTINIVRKPVKLVMVLDRSGSMECPPGDYNWAACIAPNFSLDSRWAKLKTAVNLTATKLVEFGRAGDQAAIVLFDGVTIINPFTDPTAGGFETSVTTLLDAQVQPLGRNGTAIGKGMKDAVLQLPVDATKRRVIMLFTDGEQNVPPNVRDFNPSLGKFVEDGGPFLLNNGSSPDTIEKFTVGFGSLPAAYNTLLENIASGTSNYFSTTTGSDGTFGALISGDFNNQIFFQSSPQNVVERNGSASGSFQESATFNQKISGLFLEVSLDNSTTREFQFTIWHNGQNVTQLTKKARILTTAAIFIFDRQRLLNAGIPIEGQWELRATRIPGAGSSAAKYTFAATADDHLLDMNFNPGAIRYKPGDKVKPSVKLVYASKPVTGAKVTALLVEPKDDAAHEIAVEKVQNFDPSSDPNAGTLYVQKLGKLTAANPAYLDKFVDKNPTNKITLTDPDNDGNYTGEFPSGLTMSGVHHLVYFIEYANGTDSIIRQKRLTLLVRNADIDRSKSAIVLSTAGNAQTLSLMPVDKRSKRLGLGLTFHLESPNARITNVQEKIDGSYVLTISGKLKGKGKLTVLDTPIYDGNLSNLKCYNKNAGFFRKVCCFFKRLFGNI